MVVIQVPAQRAAHEAERRDWWRSAACREADPELFFPVSACGPGAGEVARAKAVCAGCQVRRECLQYALATRQSHGVWGGTTEEERQLHARRDGERGREQRGRAGLARPGRGAGGTGRAAGTGRGSGSGRAAGRTRPA